MAITLDSGRQGPLTATMLVTGGTDVTTVAAYPAIQLPAGAIVTGGYVAILTAFNATVDLDIGDSDDPDRYTPTILEGDAGAGTVTQLITTGYKYTATTTLDFSVVVATASAGVARLVVEYIIDERACEVQG